MKTCLESRKFREVIIDNYVLLLYLIDVDSFEGRGGCSLFLKIPYYESKTLFTQSCWHFAILDTEPFRNMRKERQEYRRALPADITKRANTVCRTRIHHTHTHTYTRMSSRVHHVIVLSTLSAYCWCCLSLAFCRI